MAPSLKTDEDAQFSVPEFNGRQLMFVLAMIFAAAITPWAVFVLYMSR